MRSLFPVLLSVFLFQSLRAQSAEALKPVQDAVDAVTNDSDLAHAQWGFVLMDATTGKVLLEHGADQTLLPASTMKTVTSAAAFDILGPEFKFETQLRIDGDIDANGVLQGNVIIQGGGDPTLGSDRFKWGTDVEGVLAEWTEALAGKGIKSVNGMVIGDARIFEDAMLPTTWVWSDIGNYYGAGASGLTFCENTYYVYFKPHATVGERAELLRVEPAMPEIQFINEMETGPRGSGDQGYVYGAPYTYLRYLRGSIPQGKDEFYIKGSIPDPPHYTATRLKQALEAKGISVSGEAESMRRLKFADKLPVAESKKIHSHWSPPLKDIIYWLNKKSFNLYAEHLVKMIGVKRQQSGTNAAGTSAITAYWRGRGVDTQGFHMMDGSGLSRYNGITARQMTHMLQLNVQQPWFEEFYGTLPIAGLASDPGTLRNMCSGTAAANNVRAKSGYISRVRTYAGYVDTKGGQRLVFAMMANNYTCKNSYIKSLYEKIMVAMAEMP